MFGGDQTGRAQIFGRLVTVGGGGEMTVTGFGGRPGVPPWYVLIDLQAQGQRDGKFDKALKIIAI
ncbi:MAG TPA: hypothetical protein DCQ06_02600 [Myxococcales bacterium]|nr:hypothetical protein [Myxococcales bacterium]